MMLLPCFFIIVLSLFGLLSGCATSPVYQSADTNVPHATIREVDQGVFYERTFIVTHVDNTPVSNSWMKDFSVNVSPGKHVISVKATFSQGGFKPVVYATTNLTLIAKAGEMYLLNASIKGNKITMWINTLQGQVVSQKVTAVDLPINVTVVNVTPLAR